MAKARTSDEVHESYRRAAQVLATARREGRLRAVVFSSARSGEGVTTAVLHVAEHLRGEFALAPLVVELNRRRPALASRFGLDRTRSVEAVATGRAMAKACVQRTRSGIDVLAASGEDTTGGAPFDVTLVLRRILDQAGMDFDLVLIDAPAILERADAIAAVTVVPHVILIVEAGRTQREALERVRAELARENATVVGSILTKHKRFIPEWLYAWLVRH
jgi:Mrp family chromosome partitioning ATPase